MAEKILVVNLMYIGDLLFMTPLLNQLRRQFPQAHITLLADKKNADVVQYNPHITELMAIDKKGYHNKLSNYIQLIRDIRKTQYDLVINLHANERASAIAAFSGAKQIIGFSARGFGTFFSTVVKERTDIHQADAYLEVLHVFGNDLQGDSGLEMWVDQKTDDKADIMWQEAFSHLLGNNPVIALNTGGSWPTKRWTKQGFAKLADYLLEQGFGVAFFGGPMDQEDVAAVLQLMKQADHSNLAVFTGKTTLLEMAALVKRCALLVSGDSGPMHIAVSQKVPVISIFGPSNPVRYAPYKQSKSVVISSHDCLRCGLHRCEKGHICMEDISAELIIEKVKQKLQAYSGEEIVH